MNPHTKRCFGVGMKIMVCAGEVSGDAHGAHLVKELKKLQPDIYFFGLGSEKLAAAGVDIKLDISKRGTIGIFEVLPNLLPIYTAFLKMKKLLLQEKPDLVLLIDSQGFNLPFAKFCKQKGFRTVYYIAPQEWLWGTPSGVKRVAETIDLIIAIFEKEYQTYKSAGANVVYFGHPLLDVVKARIVSRPSSIVIALCPGSRTQEIRWSLPLFLETAKLIKKEIPEANFVIPAASKEIYKIITNNLRLNDFDELSRVVAVVGNREVYSLVSDPYRALSTSTLALCTSGTINLEASLLGVPNIMVYKLSRLTYWLGKYVLKIDKKLPFFSMPNLLAEEKIIPELIMEEANPRRIAQEALLILKDQEKVKKMKTGFQKIRQKLGSEGAIRKAAEAILRNRIRGGSAA